MAPPRINSKHLLQFLLSKVRRKFRRGSSRRLRTASNPRNPQGLSKLAKHRTPSLKPTELPQRLRATLATLL